MQITHSFTKCGDQGFVGKASSVSVAGNKAGDAQPVLAKDRSSSQALKSTSTKGLSVEVGSCL